MLKTATYNAVGKDASLNVSNNKKNKKLMQMKCKHMSCMNDQWVFDTEYWQTQFILSLSYRIQSTGNPLNYMEINDILASKVIQSAYIYIYIIYTSEQQKSD